MEDSYEQPQYPTPSSLGNDPLLINFRNPRAVRPHETENGYTISWIRIPVHRLCDNLDRT